MAKITFRKYGSVLIDGKPTKFWVKTGDKIGARPEHLWFVGQGDNPLRGSFGCKTRKEAVMSVEGLVPA